MLGKLNSFWLKVEKAGVVAGFLVMSTVVFADVLHRESADIIAGVEWTEPVGEEAASLDAAVLADQRSRHESATRTVMILPLVFWGLGWMAIRTATRDRVPHARAAAYAVAVPIVVFGFSWAFVKVVPNGVIWAQTLALVLTIWVGFLGGSIATAEQMHLKVDAAEKLFHGDTKRKVGVAADVVAALFTGFLGSLSFVFCMTKYALWSETEGAAGNFSGLPIPQWVGFAVLPLTLLTTSARFLSLAWLRWHGRAPAPKALGTAENS